MAGRVALVLLVGLLVAANAGAGFLERHVEGAPETFRTATGLPGDRAVYGVSFVLVVGGTGIVTDAEASYAFERLPDEWLPSPEGPVRSSVFVTEWTTASFGFSAWQGAWQEGWQEDWHGQETRQEVQGTPWQATHHVDGRPVAATLRSDDPRLPAAAVPAPLDAWADGPATVTLPGGLAGPCGHAHGLQGTAHDLRQAVAVSGQCPPPMQLGDARREAVEAPMLRVSGEDVVDGRPALVFSHPADPDELRIWFAADTPYPVRVLARMPGLFDGLPGMEAAGMPSVYALYELEHFERGTAATPPSPPTTAFGPTGRLGPAGPAPQVPFPLDDAFAVAKDDADVRAFLDDHPGATVRAARHAAVVEDDGAATTGIWRFTLADDRDAIDVTVERWHGPMGQETVPVALPDGWPTEDEDRVAVRPADAPAAWPAEAPDVASLAAWHENWAGAPSAPHGHGRGFGTVCADLDCHAQVQGLWWSEERTEARHENGERRVTSSVRAWTMLGTDGAFLGRIAQPPVYPGPAFAGGDEAPAWGGQDPWAWDVASVGFWSFPEPKTVAAVSAGAVLVGALLFLLTGAKGIGTWGLFSRIRDDRLLDHPGRQAIVEAVRAAPGQHFQALARTLGMGRGTLEHHLHKLVDAGLVVARADGGFTCYFPKGEVDRRVMRAAPALKSDGGRRVLETVLAMPGLSGKELAERVGMSPSTAHHHVTRLIRAGLVHTWRDGRSLRLKAQEQAPAALAAFTPGAARTAVPAGS